jgi:hypothetical protein
MTGAACSVGVVAAQFPPKGYDGQGWGEGHALIQSNLMAPAPATAALIMAALASGAPEEWRRQLFYVLSCLCCGEQDDVADQCLEIARAGKWVLYEELASWRHGGGPATAYEVLSLMSEERDRLAVFHAALREKMPDDLK